MRLTLRNVWTLESRGYLGPGYTWDNGIPGSGHTKDPSTRTTRVLLGSRLAVALIRHALLCLLCNSLLCCDMRCVACCGRFAWPVPGKPPGICSKPSVFEKPCVFEKRRVSPRFGRFAGVLQRCEIPLPGGCRHSDVPLKISCWPKPFDS